MMMMTRSKQGLVYSTTTTFLLKLLIVSILQPSAAALRPLQSTTHEPQLRHHLRYRPKTIPSTNCFRTQSVGSASDVLGMEEISNFASDHGIRLSLKTFGPGYRGVASLQNDPETILGYIEGFQRPMGKILHADKMEIFKGALTSARKKEEAFQGGGTFLGPGLLIAYVCLLHGKESGCETCEFLAIDDAEFQHKRLVRYYKMAGFEDVRYVGEELKDIPDRLVWGGCGTLMTQNIEHILRKWTRIIKNSA